MSNLFKKANVPYLVASSLATLTLISSLVLAVTSIANPKKVSSKSERRYN